MSKLSLVFAGVLCAIGLGVGGVGCGGSSTTGTGGSSGSGGAMGSAGTTGGAGTTGAGGTTGGAGRGGATGGGGRGGATGAGGGAAASCSVCDKAGACCVAAANSLGQSSAGCSMFSTSSCNGMSGMAQSTLATNCQTVLTTAAPLNLAACK